MKASRIFFISIAIFTFFSQIVAHADELPESGKIIIDKYINKLDISFTYEVKAKKISPYGLSFHGDSIKKNYGSPINGNDVDRDANIIYEYLLDKNIIRKTQGNKGTIILGEYKIKSIDKIKTTKVNECLYYKIAFTYYPELIIDKYLGGIEMPAYKGFANLVYDEFKEQWIVHEDLGRVYSIAGNNSYHLLEINEDHFGDVYRMMALLINQENNKKIEEEGYHFKIRYGNNDKFTNLNIKDDGNAVILQNGASIRIFNYSPDVSSVISGYSGPGLYVEIKEKNTSVKSFLLRDYPDYDAHKRGKMVIHYIK